MQSSFNSDFFTANRKKLQKTLGDDTPIVITGNGLMQRSADEPQKFNQDSNFWYLTGLNGTDLTLVIHPKETYLIVPILSFEREMFDGEHDLEAYAARSGITTLLPAKEGWTRLKQELASESTVATLGSPPALMKRHGLHTLPFRRRLLEKLKRLKPGIATRDIRGELMQLRSVKQPEELQALQQAVDITCATLNDILAPKVLSQATYEYQLEAAITYGFRSRGAEGHAFDPIAAAGKHSTTMHHLENNGPIAKNDLIVIDIGASVEHYSADVARTVCQSPMNKRQQAVFQAVLDAQNYAISLMKPGVVHIEYEKQVEQFVGEKLLELGVIAEPTRENIRRHFPHMTSHFLGLDTHDVGDYRGAWQENTVIVCEPGIYIPEEGIGVRIEDDILITKNGCKVLSAACPREFAPVQ